MEHLTRVLSMVSLCGGCFGVGCWVPSAYATDYTQDANIVSWWYMEEATGATRLDGSSNNNDLAESTGDDIGQSTDAKQGTYSADFESADDESLSNQRRRSDRLGHHREHFGRCMDQIRSQTQRRRG